MCQKLNVAENWIVRVMLMMMLMGMLMMMLMKMLMMMLMMMLIIQMKMITGTSAALNPAVADSQQRRRRKLKTPTTNCK